jgi:HEAT repeat protein
MGDTKDVDSMWDEKPAPKSRLGLVIWLGLLVLIAAGWVGFGELLSPKWAWRRAVHSSDVQVKTDLWSRLQRESLIDGLDRESTIREVSALLDDPDPATRGWAVATVPSIKADPRIAFPGIVGKLKDFDKSVRIKAAAALGEMVARGQPGREEAIAGLTLALKDSQAEVRRTAVSSIGQVVYTGGHADDPLRSGRHDDPALDLVAERLRDEDAAVKVEAAFVLACNERGNEAVPDLKALIQREPLPAPLGYLADRAFLAMTVLAIHSKEAAAFLATELAVSREGYPERPRDALAWVAKQSPDSRSVVRRLANDALRSKNLSLKHNAALLMHEIGFGPMIIPELIAALEDPSIDIRGRAVEALADLGDIDPAIIPALEAATSDPSKDVRERAYGALESIELDAIEALMMM